MLQETPKIEDQAKPQEMCTTKKRVVTFNCSQYFSNGLI